MKNKILFLGFLCFFSYLNLKASSLMVLVGNSGSGKSTLAKKLQGSLKEKTGKHSFIFSIDHYFSEASKKGEHFSTLMIPSLERALSLDFSAIAEVKFDEIMKERFIGLLHGLLEKKTELSIQLIKVDVSYEEYERRTEERNRSKDSRQHRFLYSKKSYQQQNLDQIAHIKSITENFPKLALTHFDSENGKLETLLGL